MCVDFDNDEYDFILENIRFIKTNYFNFKSLFFNNKN